MSDRRTFVKIGELFPQPEADVLECRTCGWSEEYTRTSEVLRRVDDGCPECGDSLGAEDVRSKTLDTCRVCGEDVQPPLQKYCSYYCRRVAKNVVKLYSWSFLRKYVAKRDGECVRCGSNGEYEVDHIIPHSKGGHPFDPDNLQRLCLDCHNVKGVSETDYREDGDGGVRLFPGYSNAQLSFDDFDVDEDGEDVLSEKFDPLDVS